jgi:hypothetical protein
VSEAKAAKAANERSAGSTKGATKAKAEAEDEEADEETPAKPARKRKTA